MLYLKGVGRGSCAPFEVFTSGFVLDCCRSFIYDLDSGAIGFVQGIGL